MKYLLLILIKSYWVFIPESRRRKCIFKKSCSHYVYDVAKEDGLFKGMIALKFRYSNCRPGFEVFKNPLTDEIQIVLHSKKVIDKTEINERILTN